MSEHRTPVVLRDLVPALTLALDELMSSDLERRPFVIVEDTVTRRFVQFARRYRPKTGELLFDAPMLNVILLPCPDAQTGAKWARQVLTGPLGLPVEAALVIRSDGDETN